MTAPLTSGRSGRSRLADSARATLRTRLQEEKWVTPAFVILVSAAAALLLWAGRGTTYFNVDDLSQLSTISSSPATLLEPFNGHLVLVSRIIFHAVSSAFGPQYWVLRVLGVAGIIATDVVFFALMRRRVGPSIALALTIPVLFLGSAWELLFWATGQLTTVYAIAGGLGALLAVEERSHRGDLIACGLLIFSLASFSIGVCFAAGVAVSVMLHSDRWRRAWLFFVPLALWSAWWLWARKFGETELKADNLSRLPGYYAHSLEAVTASLTGLIGVGGGGVGFRTPPPRNLSAGPILGLIAAAAIAVLFVRRVGVIRRTLWPPLVTLATYWTLTGLAVGPGRGPEASRYMLPGVILVLLVVAEGARGIRARPLGLVALYAVAIVMAGLNLVILRQGRQFFTAYADNTRAQLAMLELAGPNARPDFNPALSTRAASGDYLLIRTGEYLRGVRHYGSPADTLAEVEAKPNDTRQRADAVLIGALGLGLHAPAGRTASSRPCRVVARRSPSAPLSVSLPRGGATLRADRVSVLLLGRFGRPPATPVGLLAPGRREELAIPVDRASVTWTATATGIGAVSGPIRLEVCALAA